MTIDAPVEDVWPWLAQLGQDRGGFYNYETLENLAGCKMRNADHIHREWQHRELGETVHLHPAGRLRVSVFKPGRALGFEGWGTFAVEPGGQAGPPGRSSAVSAAASVAYGVLMELPHFLIQWRMLLAVKQRAETKRGNDSRWTVRRRARLTPVWQPAARRGAAPRAA